MASLFQSFEEEYKEFEAKATDTVAKLRATLNRNAPNYKPPPPVGVGSRSALLSQIKQSYTRLVELENSMYTEVNDFLPAQKQAGKDRITQIKKSNTSLAGEIERLEKEVCTADREDLLKDTKPTKKGESTADPQSGTLDDQSTKDRKELVKSTETLRGTSKTLMQAEALVGSALDKGNNTKKELGKQREHIQSITGTTEGVDQELSEARKLLNQIQSVMIKNKAIMVGIIILLMIMILVIIYLQISGPSSSQAPIIVVPPPPPPPPDSTNGGGIGSGAPNSTPEPPAPTSGILGT